MKTIPIDTGPVAIYTALQSQNPVYCLLAFQSSTTGGLFQIFTCTFDKLSSIFFSCENNSKTLERVAHTETGIPCQALRFWFFHDLCVTFLGWDPYRWVYVLFVVTFTVSFPSASHCSQCRQNATGFVQSTECIWLGSMGLAVGFILSHYKLWNKNFHSTPSCFSCAKQGSKSMQSHTKFSAQS